jgi:hypothetical protein
VRPPIKTGISICITSLQALDNKSTGAEAGIRTHIYEWLGMVWVDLQIGKQKRFTAGLMAATIGLYRDEDCVDLRQCFRVVTL